MESPPSFEAFAGAALAWAQAEPAVGVPLPPFDARVVDALAWAAAEADAAAQALLLAAEYLRSGEPMPQDLVEHLAGAIESSMHEPSGVREIQFLQSLKLTAKNARPKGNYYEVGLVVEESLRAGDNITTALDEVIADPRFKIESRATARKLYNQYLRARAEHDSIP